MRYKRLKLKLRVFLAGHNVVMVTYCARKLTATCSPVIGQFVDTMMLANELANSETNERIQRQPTCIRA